MLNAEEEPLDCVIIVTNGFDTIQSIVHKKKKIKRWEMAGMIKLKSIGTIDRDKRVRTGGS